MTQASKIYASEDLKSKRGFDRVGLLNTKPSVSAEGFEISDSGNETEDGKLDISILTESPNLYKQSGDSMSEQGFIKLPRSLISSPEWRGMRTKYQKLFLIILEHAAYSKKEFSFNGNIIKINPGQLCISFRRLAEIYNQDIKFNEDKITPSLVQRGVSVFFQFSFAIHEPIHGITMITITHPELYEHFKRISDTPSDTKPIHNRYTNEEREEDKYDPIKETIIDNEESDESFLSNQKKEEAVEILKAWFETHNLKISFNTIGIWMAKFTFDHITAQANLLLESNIEKIKNHEAWMENAMKKDFSKRRQNEKINKDFIFDFKNRNPKEDIKITLKYITYVNIDFQLWLDPKLFKRMIKEKYESINRI